MDQKHFKHTYYITEMVKLPLFLSSPTVCLGVCIEMCLPTHTHTHIPLGSFGRIHRQVPQAK